MKTVPFTTALISPIGNQVKSEHFFIIYGDEMEDIDVAAFLSFT